MEAPQKLISVVMTTYNRNEQLGHTLDSIACSRLADRVEIIIVDDASTEAPISLVKRYEDRLDINLVLITREQKWYINPGIPYNIGFSKATSDIVIIQNSEVVHIGDVLSFVRSTLKQGQYLCMGCYCLGSHAENTTFMNIVGESDHPREAALSYIKRKRDAPCVDREVGGWYISRDHFTGLHYLTAIHRNDLERVGGFDPDFAHGHCHDDDEFIRRIWHNKLEIIYPDVDNNHPFSVHLYHDYVLRQGDAFVEKWKINNAVFNRKVAKYGFRELTPFMNETLPHTVI